MVPIVITAVAALPFVGAEYGIVLNGVIVLTYYLVNYNFLCYIARLCQSNNSDATYITCVTQALVRLVMLAGIIGGQFFLANNTMGDFAKLCALALAVIYLISMGLIRNVLAKRGGEGELRAQAIAPNKAESSPPMEPLPLCPLDDMCSLYALTDKEAEVVFLLIEGYSVKLVAEELGVSPNTVRTHVRSIYEKMDVHTRDDLIRFYRSFEKIKERG